MVILSKYLLNQSKTYPLCYHYHWPNYHHLLAELLYCLTGSLRSYPWHSHPFFTCHCDLSEKTNMIMSLPYLKPSNGFLFKSSMAWVPACLLTIALYIKIKIWFARPSKIWPLPTSPDIFIQAFFWFLEQDTVWILSTKKAGIIYQCILRVWLIVAINKY